MAESWRTRLARALSAAPGSRGEMIRMLRAAERKGLVNADALGMIEGALAVAHLQVRDIMVPRTGMVVVDRDKRPEEFIDTVVESGHSRFPVLGDGRDDVDGILLAKDLLRYFALERKRDFDLRDAMRPRLVRAGEQAAQRVAQGVPERPEPHGHRGERVGGGWRDW